MIRSLVVRPDEEPFEFNIKRKFESIKQFERLSLTIAEYSNLVIVCMERPLVFGVRFNRKIGNHLIFGTVVIVGLDGKGAFRSLTSEEIQALYEHLNIGLELNHYENYSLSN